MFIFTGLLMIVGGTGLVIKTEWVLNNFGRITWFEKKLGSEGGSRLGYKLIGILLLIIGIITMTGSGNNFIAWLLGPLLKYGPTK